MATKEQIIEHLTAMLSSTSNYIAFTREAAEIIAAAMQDDVVEVPFDIGQEVFLRDGYGSTSERTIAVSNTKRPWTIQNIQLEKSGDGAYIIRLLCHSGSRRSIFRTDWVESVQ